MLILMLVTLILQNDRAQAVKTRKEVVKICMKEVTYDHLLPLH